MKQTRVDHNGILKKAYKPSQAPALANKKQIQRARIHNEVMDLEDSVADTAKIASLTLSVVARIWKAIPDADKTAVISAEDIALTDQMLALFATTNTRADIQLQKEGAPMIQRLIANQGKIGTIIDEES